MKGEGLSWGQGGFFVWLVRGEGDVFDQATIGADFQGQAILSAVGTGYLSGQVGVELGEHLVDVLDVFQVHDVSFTAAKCAEISDDQHKLRSPIYSKPFPINPSRIYCSI